jgi:hypothetical protein
MIKKGTSMKKRISWGGVVGGWVFFFSGRVLAVFVYLG